MSGHPDGPGSRAHVLPPLPNVMRHKTSPSGRNYTQGKEINAFIIVTM